MDTDREFDQDTDGDHDENTLDGSEGLDADVISTDGEDLTVDAPESWKPVEENDTLDEKLAAERPDVDSPEPEDGGVPTEPHDAIDDLDPEGGTRVLGEA
ncbi:hypothetical protein [Dietzia sp. B32]|uniref:hypothetical protein n=1 Tax=Dietzia sp. B32 TaxID=2915130 RepID=UPI0021ADB1C8|nr:hypothetical protein [Dietzia sp. B32]UVE95806.1 hypothetical protein L8M95_03130 [Dietzia sp. B32]